MVCLTTYDSSETRSLRTWLHALDSRGGVGGGGVVVTGLNLGWEHAGLAPWSEAVVVNGACRCTAAVRER